MTRAQKILLLLLVLNAGLLWHAERRGMEEVKGEKIALEDAKNRKAGGLALHVLDIGQGDATYMEFPNGQDMLVDCSKDARILSALSRVMRASDTRIDYLVVTHPDLDHYGGCIDLLKRFDVGRVVYTGYEKDGSGLYDAFWNAVTGEVAGGAEYDAQRETRTWIVASSTIEFVYPDHDVSADERIPGVSTSDTGNNTSIVMRVSYGGTSALLTGDMGMDLERYLAAEYPDLLDADILKVGHHGSAGSTGDEFLRAVTPREAVISSGKENSYGHPTLRVLRKLERIGARVWRTDTDGDITVRFRLAGYDIE